MASPRKDRIRRSQASTICYQWLARFHRRPLSLLQRGLSRRNCLREDLGDKPSSPYSSEDSNEKSLSSAPSLVIKKTRKLYDLSMDEPYFDDSGEDSRKKTKDEPYFDDSGEESRKKTKENQKSSKNKNQNRKSLSREKKENPNHKDEHPSDPSDDDKDRGDEMSSNSDSSSDSIPDGYYGSESSSDDSKACFEEKTSSKKHKASPKNKKKKDLAACIAKRPVIPSNLKWDNKQKTFPESKNCFEAHIIQAGMNYIMIKPLFVRRYKKYGRHVLNLCKNTLSVSNCSSYMTLMSFMATLNWCFGQEWLKGTCGRTRRRMMG